MASDNCTVPISEINKLTAEIWALRKAAVELLESCQHAGHPVMKLSNLPSEAHPDSICAASLRSALKLRQTLMDRER